MTKQQSKIPHGWQISKLEDIAVVFDGQHTTPTYVNKGIPFYSAENVSGSEPCKFISVEEYERNSKGRVPKKGDILITRIGSLCQSIVADWTGKFGIYVTLAAIQTKPTIINNYFLNQLFKSDMYKKEFFSKALLTAYPQKINMEDLRATSVLFPPMKEQQKIVRVLESWDRAIETTQKLIAAKEKQKEYFLKHFILKVKDTNSFLISELLTLGRGRVISNKYITEHVGKYPVYSSQTTDDGVLGKINTYDFDGEYLTWTTDGAKAGAVFLRTGKFNCTNVCGIGKLKNTATANILYLVEYLNQVTKRYVSYVGNPKLMNNIFASIKVNLPDKCMQDKVANVIAEIDKEIDLLKQKLTKLQEQKKGLMQVLLTGQVRLKI